MNVQKRNKKSQNKTEHKINNITFKITKITYQIKSINKRTQNSNKHNHQSSTFTLLSNHNNSQFSLIDADEDNVRKGKSKNMRQSVTSLLGKEPANKDKDK